MPTEADDVLASGVVASELQGALDGLSAGVAVVEAVRSGHRRDGGEARGERRHLVVVEVRAGHVDQLGRLILDGLHDFGMAVAGRGDGDAGGEVEELVAVDVFDSATAAAFDDQRITAGVARGKQAIVFGNDALGVGAGQGAEDLRAEAGVGLRGGSARELQDHGAHRELSFLSAFGGAGIAPGGQQNRACGDATVFAKDGEAAGVKPGRIRRLRCPGGASRRRKDWGGWCWEGRSERHAPGAMSVGRSLRSEPKG